MVVAVADIGVGVVVDEVVVIAVLAVLAVVGIAVAVVVMPLFLCLWLLW